MLVKLKTWAASKVLQGLDGLNRRDLERAQSFSQDKPDVAIYLPTGQWHPLPGTTVEIMLVGDEPLGTIRYRSTP